jgi:hypothetical protein
MFHPSTLLHVSVPKDHHQVDKHEYKNIIAYQYGSISVYIVQNHSRLFMDECLVMWFCVSEVCVYKHNRSEIVAVLGPYEALPYYTYSVCIRCVYLKCII